MSEPRVQPLSVRQMGLGNRVFAWYYARRLGVRKMPHVFSVLAHNRRLFRPYFAFLYHLMPGGSLHRADTELLILRVAANTGCHYEWHHHTRMARQAGLTESDIERIKIGPEGDGWSSKQKTLLRAADELQKDHHIHDETWSQLEMWFSVSELIEVCLLVGTYHSLATVLMTLNVRPEGSDLSSH